MSFVRVDEETEWRVADRPARDLFDRIIDKVQSLAISNDQQWTAVLILEPYFPRTLKGKNPRNRPAIAVGLRKVRRHATDCAQVRHDLSELVGPRGAGS